ncbi:MAG: glycosyltransferase family 4 protein [Bacteroidia bacterium]|jgi:glycosyltransferase involved in cell wall biosynthesis|uniref:glycosyltransferase family 4 protein n=1 Tax=Candidatus Pollutiaquabacter sp. TaxID=3416354 RepID=UPI001A5DF810|nr:glycosyltransferase family 4 protein [Bacteroidota bacterium]MBL7948379.1 glycosyltransferase family 4 protein [Bacteroidia bacterium]MBP6010108.1 glycosyltransferase family 4 protein [Bacteroidia bacterium]MBP7269285.1 glycosyltransferase family 4 protein [Bacteroidia bacterium]MBP7437437.1 glycosyltransferase family 4 protein [Bacteroidia bacterium]
MKILYLTYDGLSDPLGQSQVIPYIVGLSKRGHKIVVLSSEKKAPAELLATIRKNLEKHQIEWHSITYTKRPPVLSTIYDVLRMTLRSIRLNKVHRFGIVHCRSYITSLIGYYLKKSRDIRFIFDMRGFFADERIDGEMWDQNKFIYRLIYSFFKRFEAKFLNAASYTVCLTESAQKEIWSWRSIPRQPIRIKVIPCCVDTTIFDPEKVEPQSRSQLMDELNIKPDDIVLSYIGAIGTWYLLDEMLEFFRKLKQSYPNAKFLFVTHKEQQDIKARWGKNGLNPEDLIIRSSNHQQVPCLLSLSHLSIFFIKPVYSKIASSPAKMAEIMSMGIPVLCNANVGDTSEIIQKTGTGVVVQSFSEMDYDFIIEQIPQLLSIPSQKIRNAAIEHFSLDVGVLSYEQVYKLAQ